MRERYVFLCIHARCGVEIECVTCFLGFAQEKREGEGILMVVHAYNFMFFFSLGDDKYHGATPSSSRTKPTCSCLHSLRFPSNCATLINMIDDSGVYETKPIQGETTVQVLREYVGYDLDGPARARVVGQGPALVAISKEGGLLRFSGTLGGAAPVPTV